MKVGKCFDKLSDSVSRITLVLGVSYNLELLL
jgi:hypothetical protein